MNCIYDIHTHHTAPQPQAVIALSAVDLAKRFSSPQQVELLPGQVYSIGIHPWDLSMNPITQDVSDMLCAIAEREQVVAIGETGIDTLRPAPMFRQLQTFKLHIDLSERLAKPLIIHDVKAHDSIIGLHREMKPTQPWAIHGFRAKPTVAAMFTSLGIYLSFGARFNADTLRRMPEHLILAETDEAPESIADVLAAISQTKAADMIPAIAANTARFLTLK